ncbi:YerC/YecD family TrpR-related protein [Ureibacillus sp. 179-F W5.1 NHS]|uniref:TrpR-related protein YerC/YecD n=1 Tax=Lysinibacillus halotolerans TaxID=1368476 RepID=A0A3M8HAM4_9BACI|nr:YerC/YecD family TrpR-related protein [Lysinibacillus halotolerans]RNC99426.1 hypothetical protein EC501_07845 [Lysinibacillus halotolerans]
MDNLYDYKTEQLMKAFLALRTMEECEDFFNDLCTQKEILAFAQRLEVARLLLNGHTYEEIEELTYATYKTISRVRKVLHNQHLKCILNRINSSAQ